jgi:hypothetical protein
MNPFFITARIPFTFQEFSFISNSPSISNDTPSVQRRGGFVTTCNKTGVGVLDVKFLSRYLVSLSIASACFWLPWFVPLGRDNYFTFPLFGNIFPNP